ncbi:unnamed protein product [Eruca vesicaria subsp. sativa]|uniref:Uncharacterized protein n=1 Tax=Eruca vesicaria subsp. sativa TaxID=29727 RepID=A0ABC8JFS4_ERUVS|nr:unnamed protein product [Eruca vesicaria subsp. sativa]
MAKICFVLLVVALIAFLHVSEAQPPKDKNGDEKVIENDLHEAKDLIEEDLKEKEKNIKDLESEVSMLTKSEKMLNDIGEAYKKGKSLEPYGKKLKKFNRKVKQAPKGKRYGSVVQNILKDLGLNGGRN